MCNAMSIRCGLVGLIVSLLLLHLRGLSANTTGDSGHNKVSSDHKGNLVENEQQPEGEQVGPSAADNESDHVNSSFVLMGPSVRYFSVLPKRLMTDVTKSIVEDLVRCFCKRYWVVRDIYGGPLNKSCEIAPLVEEINFKNNLYAYGLYFNASIEWDKKAHRVHRRSNNGTTQENIQLPEKCFVSLTETLEPIIRRHHLLTFSQRAVFIGVALEQVPYKRMRPPCSIGQLCHVSTISMIIMSGFAAFLVTVALFTKTKEDISFWIKAGTGKEAELPNAADFHRRHSIVATAN